MKHASLFTVPFLETMDYPLTQQGDTRDASASKNETQLYSPLEESHE